MKKNLLPGRSADFRFRFFNLLFAVLLSSCFSLSAKEVTIGKLKYKVNTTDKIAKCTGLAKEATQNYNLVIPSTVEYNGVTLKVTTVEKEAFWFDLYLKKVTLSDYTETIGSKAFASCDRLSIVSLGKKLKIIGAEAFAHCGNTGTFTSVTLPSTVEIIRDHAFMDCRSLTSVTFGNNIESIGDNAFWNCVALKSIQLPGSLKTIGESAFASCEALYEVAFRSGTGNTVIGDKCFNNNKSLTLLSFFGPGVAEIGHDAFINCRIQWLALPSSLHTIGQGAFSSNNLTTLDIPEGVKNIGAFAFEGQYGLGMKALTIPSSVVSIGKKAFYDIGRLETLTCKAVGVPMAEEQAFDNYVKDYCDLWVPVASLQKYMVAPEWKDFARINNVPTGIDEVQLGDQEEAAEEEWFDMAGNRVNKECAAPGIYVIRRNGKTEKRIIR